MNGASALNNILWYCSPDILLTAGAGGKPAADGSLFDSNAFSPRVYRLFNTV
jgi:hypothetical protein